MKLRHMVRDWAQSYAKRGKYSPVGVWFHWVMAAIVLYQLWSGWMMQRYPVGGDKLAAYAQHSEIGLTLLLLASLRGLWRLYIPGPNNNPDAPEWQKRAAWMTHVLFYLLFALLPLSGWCMWSAIQPAQPLYLAGIIPMPPMPFYDLSPEWQFQVLNWAENLHFLGIIGLVLLVPMHVGAALKHHFIDRDEVVEGMLPEIQDHPATRSN